MKNVKAKQYILDFEKLGFGMFVHFGLYSAIGLGEWRADTQPIEEAEYKALAKEFCPDSMEDIVLTAKSAGAKYVTLTTKHHDGFALFDTHGLTDFDITHSGAGRDLVEEFVVACRKHDIVPILYYATFEWWNRDFDDNFDKYLEYLRKNVEILCTQYGKIGGLWFDGNWRKKGADWKETELYATIRKYQPEAIIVNNTGLGGQGKTGNPEIDCVTFERGRATPINRENAEKYITGEVCDSVNMHWGLAKDLNYKSTKRLIEELCECRKVGANFLLNVGPNAKGQVPLMPKAIMQVIGEWMDMFGEAIYDGKPFWYRSECRNFALRSADYVYLFCFDLCRKGSANVVYMQGGEGEFAFEDFPCKVEDVHWMDNEERLNFRYEKDALIVDFTGFEYGIDYCVRVAKAKILEEEQLKESN